MSTRQLFELLRYLSNMNVYDYINGLKNMSFTNTMLMNTYTDVRSGQPDMIDVCCLFVLLYDDEMMTGQSSVV